MKKIFTIPIIFLLFFSVFSPVLTKSAGLVPDCGKLSEKLSEDGIKMVDVIEDPCDFDDLMALINNVIRFLLFFLATPIAAIAFAYAGFLYLFDGGNTQQVSKAKKIMRNVLIGYVVALAAFLIVRTIMVSLGFTDAGTFLDLAK